MDVMYFRRKPDNHHPILHRDCDMMPRILKKFPGEFRIDRIVKHPRSHIPENALITALQDLDFESRAAVSNVTGFSLPQFLPPIPKGLRPPA